MLNYGWGLSLYCGSSVPFLRVGCIQTESNWHNNGRGSSNCLHNLTRRSIGCKSKSSTRSVESFSFSRACRNYSLAFITAFLTAAAVIGSVVTADATREPETLSNLPQTLSGECALVKDCKKVKIQRPKSRKAESCTAKCVTTCIRGGEGSPGEGPLNVRRPLVVFKQGFRTRQYCLVECSDICNLISDVDDGP